MAVTFVGAYDSNGYGSGVIQSGDLLLLLSYVVSFNAGGWATKLAYGPYGSGANSAAAWKRATGTTETSVSNYGIYGGMVYVFRGVAPSGDPFTSFQPFSTTSPVGSAPVAAGDMGVVLVTDEDNTPTCSYGTDRGTYAYGYDDGDKNYHGVSTIVRTAAYGAAGSTGTISFNGSAGGLLVLKAAAGGGGATYLDTATVTSGSSFPGTTNVLRASGTAAVGTTGSTLNAVNVAAYNNTASLSTAVTINAPDTFIVAGVQYADTASCSVDSSFTSPSTLVGSDSGSLSTTVEISAPDVLTVFAGATYADRAISVTPSYFTIENAASLVDTASLSTAPAFTAENSRSYTGALHIEYPLLNTRMKYPFGLGGHATPGAKVRIHNSDTGEFIALVDADPTTGAWGCQLTGAYLSYRSATATFVKHDHALRSATAEVVPVIVDSSLRSSLTSLWQPVIPEPYVRGIGTTGPVPSIPEGTLPGDIMVCVTNINGAPPENWKAASTYTWVKRYEEGDTDPVIYAVSGYQPQGRIVSFGGISGDLAEYRTPDTPYFQGKMVRNHEENYYFVSTPGTSSSSLVLPAGMNPVQLDGTVIWRYSAPPAPAYDAYRAGTLSTNLGVRVNYPRALILALHIIYHNTSPHTYPLAVTFNGPPTNPNVTFTTLVELQHAGTNNASSVYSGGGVSLSYAIASSVPGDLGTTTFYETANDTMIMHHNAVIVFKPV